MSDKYVLQAYESDGSDRGGSILPRVLDEDEKALAEDVLELCQPMKNYKFVLVYSAQTGHKL